MSTSKYAGLPDIEEGAPDVFETPDVPADFNYEHADDSDSELYAPTLAPQRSNSSEDIVGDHLLLDKARKRFKDANVNGNADFSTKLTSRRRKQRPLYPALLPDSKTYEYMPRGYSTGPSEPIASTSETALQRLRRLRIEAEEVEAQLQAEKQQQLASAPDTATEQRREIPTGALLAQLRYLRNDLARLNASAEEGERPFPVPDSSKAPQTAEDTASSQLKDAPAMEDLAKKAISGLPSDLDERLIRLERFIGTGEAESGEAGSAAPPLITTLSRLEHQFQLLTQPRHLDTVARRVKTLVGDLERLHERRRKEGDTRPLNVALASGMTVVTTTDDGSAAQPILPGSEESNLPADALQKIDALFALLPRIEPSLALAPQLLTRLKTLAPLHATAADFQSTLSNVQRESSSLKESERGLKEAIEGLTKSMTGNEQVVRGNLESLEQRVEAISKRMEALRA